MELSNLLWAFANVGASASTLFREARLLICGSTKFVESLSGYDLAQLAVAYVRARDVDPEDELLVLVELSRQAPSVLPASRKLQDAANLAWAIADNRELASKLRDGGCSVAYGAIAQLGASRAEEFSAQELSICLKSMADFEPTLPAHYLLEFLRAVEPVALKRMHDFTPEGLGKMLSGYVRVRPHIRASPCIRLHLLHSPCSAHLLTHTHQLHLLLLGRCDCMLSWNPSRHTSAGVTR